MYFMRELFCLTPPLAAVICIVLLHASEKRVRGRRGVEEKGERDRKGGAWREGEDKGGARDVGRKSRWRLESRWACPIHLQLLLFALSFLHLTSCSSICEKGTEPSE